MLEILKKSIWLVLLALAACETHVETNPPRTANEQMLISTAADRAAEQLKMGIRPGTKIFVDAANFEGTDSKYAIGAIRTAMLKQGGALVADRKSADLVVEPRAGALSTNQDSFLIGIPSISLPVPLTANSLTLPELAIYKKATQTGLAKFAATSYTAKDGNLALAEDPQYGFSHKNDYVVMFVVSWTSDDAFPDEDALEEQRQAASAHAPRQGTDTDK
jgi:hypothetical protein